MASKSQSGRGTAVSIGALTGTTGTEVFNKIGEATKCSIGGITVDIEDVSNFDSGFFKEKLGTMGDPGQVDIGYNYVAGATDVGQAAVTAAGATGLPYDFQIQLPKNAKLAQVTNGDKFAFSAIIKKFNSLDVTTKGVLTGSLQLEITGPITFTAGA